MKKKWIIAGTTFLLLAPSLTVSSQVLAAEETVVNKTSESIQTLGEELKIERTQTVFASTRATYNIHSDVGGLTFVSSNSDVARVSGLTESDNSSGSFEHDYLINLSTENPGSTVVYGQNANGDVVPGTAVLIEVVEFDESYLNPAVTSEKLTLEYYWPFTEVDEYGGEYTYYYVVDNDILDADHELKTILDHGENGMKEFHYYTKNFTTKTPGTTKVYGFREGTHIETYEVTVNPYEYTKTEYVTRDIPFEVDYVEDSTLEKGEEVVEKEGINGVILDEYEVSYMGGGENGRKRVSSTITREPVNKVIRVGTSETYTPLYEDYPVGYAWDFGVWSNYENGSKVASSFNDFAGMKLTILKEAKDHNKNVWVLFQVDGETIGWVNKAGLRGQLPKVDVLYTDTPVADAWNYGVWTNYVNGSKVSGSLNNYRGKTLHIIAEATDKNGTSWVQFQVDDRTIGWVSQLGLTENKPSIEVLYTDKAVTDAWNYGVWSNYENGKKLPGSLNNYAGKTLSILAEATDSSGITWVQFQANGKTVGWVSKLGITSGKVNIPDFYYSVLPVSNAWDYGIWSNYENGKYITSLNDYAGRFVRVVEETKVGSNNIWAKITVDGKDIGWVSKRGLRVGSPNTYIRYSRKPVASAWDYSVWSNHTNGSKVGGSLNDYAGKTLNVIDEATIGGIKWVRFEHQGRTIGWVARQGLEK